jgi:hypothetical protein
MPPAIQSSITVSADARGAPILHPFNMLATGAPIAHAASVAALERRIKSLRLIFVSFIDQIFISINDLRIGVSLTVIDVHDMSYDVRLIARNSPYPMSHYIFSFISHS